MKIHTTRRRGDVFSMPVARGAVICDGAIVVSDGGYAKPGRLAPGLVFLGRADSEADDSEEATGVPNGTGELTVLIRRDGWFQWDTVDGADAITQADVGKTGYIHDDRTVTRNPEGASPAGLILDVDDEGVWIESGSSAPATESGGGGNSLLIAESSVDAELGSLAARQATVLTIDVTVAGLEVGRRVSVGPEFHEITAVDPANRQITIAAPGLIAQQPSGAPVIQAPLNGSDDTLTLPDPGEGRSYKDLVIEALYAMPLNSNGQSARTGRSRGRFAAAADGSDRASWYEILTDRAAWLGGMNYDPTYTTYAVGVVSHSQTSFRDAWTLEYNPATRQLSWLEVDSNNAASRWPRIYQLMITGRAD